MVMAAFGASVMVSMVRHISLTGVNVFLIIFFRNFFGLILFLPWMYKKKLSRLRVGARIKMYSWRACVSLAAMYIWFFVIAHVNLSVATAISFTAPLLTFVMAVLFLKERSTGHRWIALCIGFLGVLVVLRPWSHEFNPYAPMALLSASLWAVAGILIKQLSRHDKPDVMAFYMILISAPLGVPLAIYNWEILELYQYGWLVTLGLVSILFQVTLNKALSMGDLTVLQPFDFMRLVFTSIIAYLAFNEVMDAQTFIGALIIFAAAIYSIYRESKHHRSIATKKTDQASAV